MSDVDPKKLKVAELKEELKTRGLDTKGKKDNLIKRLTQALNKEKGIDDDGEADISQETFDTSQEITDEEAESPVKTAPPVSFEPTIEEETPQAKEETPTSLTPEPEAPVQMVEDVQEQQQEEQSNDIRNAAGSDEAQQPMDGDNTQQVPVDRTEAEPTGEDMEQGDFVVQDEVAGDQEEHDREKHDRRKRSRSRSHSPRKRSRSRSRSPQRRRRYSPRGRSPPKRDMEDDAWLTATNVQLDKYNSDLNLRIEAEKGVKAFPMAADGFAFMWAGARATYGCNTGKVHYEVKVTEQLDVNHLPEEETTKHVIRVGWSTDSTSTQLGEEPLSYGYGGTGKASVDCKFKDFGEAFGLNDVVGASVDFENDPVTLSFTKNGAELGVCFEVSKEELGEQALFPHILSKNCEFTCNFGEQEEAFFAPPEGYTFINNVPVEERVRGTVPPAKKEECEVIMMVGLPGAGKTTWAGKHVAGNPDKRYNVLGTNNIIDKMKVMGLPRKRNYSGRWDVLIDKATKCLNRLLEIASRKKRNYIIDQTNVYQSAQRRKMRPFEGFQRKAVVIVPSDEDFKQRIENREKEEGKDVPDDAVLEMKANFGLPDVGPNFDAVEFIELDKEEAQKVVEIYNKDGQVKFPIQKPRSRDDRNQGGRFSGGYGGRRDDRYGNRRGGSLSGSGGGGGGWRDRQGGDRRGGRGGYGDRKPYDRRDSSRDRGKQGSYGSSGGRWGGHSGGSGGYNKGGSYGNQGSWNQGQSGSGSWGNQGNWGNQNWGNQGQWGNQGWGQGGYGQQNWSYGQSQQPSTQNWGQNWNQGYYGQPGYGQQQGYGNYGSSPQGYGGYNYQSSSK